MPCAIPDPSHGQAIVAAENLSSTRQRNFANAARDVVNELQGIILLDRH